MARSFTKIALVAAALLAPAYASAATMTFSGLQDFQNYSEDGITGISNSWWNWPNSGEAHFDYGSASLTMGGGAFDANNFDIAGNGGSGSVIVTGYLNNLLVTSTTFSGAGNHSFGAGYVGIDTLVFAYGGTGHFSIDNVTLDEVPEPAMLGLFGLGAIGLGMARRRKA